MVEYPRVTYSNITADFSSLHDLLDRDLGRFISEQLGRSHGNIIGKATNDLDGKHYSIPSPIDHDIKIGEFVDAAPGATGRAAAEAAAAFPLWSDTSWSDRVKALRAWRDVLAQKKYELAMASLMEVGKSRLEALGEVEEAVDLVDYYCSEMELRRGYEQELRQVVPREETKCLLRPLGAFAVIAPFNFPVALPINMISGALVTGNTAVFKPAPGCAFTGRLIAETALEAGIPAGVLNFIAGGDAVGRALVQNQNIAGVVFTGSYAAGMSIYRNLATARWAKPLIAEMGGKNPAYVTSSANLQTAAEGVARSAFGLQGQKCSSCSVAYVDVTVRDQFIGRLKAFAEKLPLGDPRDRKTFMGPAYSKASAERFDVAVREARNAGEILFGGNQTTEGAFSRGHYLQPTAVALPTQHRLTQEELFLPFLAIRTFEKLADAISEGNQVDYGLTAGIYTEQQTDLDYFLKSAQAGVLYANRSSGATTGAWPGVQTFCGWKGSGVSHKGGLGPHYLPQFMREQSHTILR